MQRTDFLPGIFLPEERFAAYGPDDLPLIELFYFDAGGGHRSAATALKAAIEQAVREERFPPCRAEMVNLQDMLENVDRIHRATQKIRSIKMQLFKNHPAEEAKKFRAEDVYNTALKHGWTFLADSLLRGLYWGIAHYGEEMAPVLEGHFRSTRPGMVVSVIPNFNHIADPALQAVLPGTPYVTIPTDLSDLLPKKAGKKQPFWLAMNRDQYVINGTPELHAQAMATGFYEPDHVIQVDGMILKPGFYRDDFADREETLRKLGLDPGKKTTLITFGGHGSAASIGIAKRLERSGLPLQNIVICGRNEKL
ncbi:MAG TPA: hypothetical protein VMV79_03975, partial [Alphaproteobacteria bacterium]|nr:hypothetical protein [Alphaproteobacteria bacterium]